MADRSVSDAVDRQTSITLLGAWGSGDHILLAIASVAAFCSHATVKLINDAAQRKLYIGAYRFLAVLMIASPIAAAFQR
jgi:hypothetical protein